MDEQPSCLESHSRTDMIKQTGMKKIKPLSDIAGWLASLSQ